MEGVLYIGGELWDHKGRCYSIYFMFQILRNEYTKCILRSVRRIKGSDIIYPRKGNRKRLVEIFGEEGIP